MSENKFNTMEEFKAEFDRLWKWRELWTRLANRNNRSDTHNSKRSAHAVFLSSLAIRDEAVQRRAWLKNQQIGQLMKEFDSWTANQAKEKCDHKKRKIIDFNEETYVATFRCPCRHQWTSKARFVCK